ncbi:periplasmic solute-binding protein [Thalassotalea insulae]|uniref:Periplasmic solute-binding protein n=1 Tax=Thalassotalea insulae TaxID=2056778 RepID=A0ABQ6GSE6_9GAMM|nr:transporter substrate-binding domain-containing protein [Thalassotalea insulae]GLX78539.1 periplasmic solute-binding protein [Thalassotalea insulae]
MSYLKAGLSLLVLCIIMSTTNAKASSFKECQVPLTLSSTTDWYPYIYQQKNISYGVDVELLQLILEQMDCQLEILHFPERRSLFELSSGNFDIALGASRTKDREQKFHYSVAYRKEQNRFVYRANDSKLTKINSLQGIIAAKKIIAINLAGWYGDEIEQAKSLYNGFIFSDTVNKRLKMLSYQRVDLVIDDDIVLCSEVERSSLPNLALHPLILSTASIHFIFNKQTVSLDFIRRFNQILTSMRTSGELEALYHQQLPASCINPIP